MIKTLLLLIAVGLLDAIIIKKPSVCSFPFLYKGQSYNECIKLDASAYWCSVEKNYNGSFSYCKVDESDVIGDEHFLALIKRSEEHAARLSVLQGLKGSKSEQCTGCIGLLKALSDSIIEQSSIFMDQNKRLQGLKAQHTYLNDAVDRLNKYYQLRRCKQTAQGGEYLGRVSVTGSGYKCQAWSSQKPNAHKYTDDGQYPENSVESAQDFCRNPGLDRAPWCYTTNPKVPFEFCFIPTCGVDCNIDAKVKSDLPLCDAYASTACSNDSIFFNNNCYKRINTPMDYHSAQRTCENLKGNLASSHSATENNFLAQTVFPGVVSFFIGLSDERREGDFVWSDNSASDYTRFYSGEPNGYRGENCVEMGRFPGLREAWNDIPCSERRGFVCKIPLNK